MPHPPPKQHYRRARDSVQAELPTLHTVNRSRSRPEACRVSLTVSQLRRRQDDISFKDAFPQHSSSSSSHTHAFKWLALKGEEALSGFDSTLFREESDVLVLAKQG